MIMFASKYIPLLPKRQGSLLLVLRPSAHMTSPPPKPLLLPHSTSSPDRPFMIAQHKALQLVRGSFQFPILHVGKYVRFCEDLLSGAVMAAIGVQRS